MHLDEGRHVLFVDSVPLSLLLRIICLKVPLITCQINNKQMASRFRLSPNRDFQLTVKCKSKILNCVFSNLLTASGSAGLKSLIPPSPFYLDLHRHVPKQNASITPGRDLMCLLEPTSSLCAELMFAHKLPKRAIAFISWHV